MGLFIDDIKNFNIFKENHDKTVKFISVPPAQQSQETLKMHKNILKTNKGGSIMFNYANLNDVEFENLCKDVMEKKLSTSLRLFAKGRDGGIDLTDDTRTHNIIVQAKHYIGSKFSNLRTTLKKGNWKC